MTHFRDFTRPDGTLVTVEFKYQGGSPDTYDPQWGAEGGDPTEVGIVRAWMTNDETDIELPDAEREKYEEWLCANLDPGDYYCDFYD